MKENHRFKPILPSPVDSGGETGAPALADKESLSTQSSSTPVSTNWQLANSTPCGPKQSPKRKRQRIGTQIACDACRYRKARVSSSTSISSSGSLIGHTIADTPSGFKHSVAVTVPVAYGARKRGLSARTLIIGTLLQPLVRPGTLTRCSSSLGQRQKRRLCLLCEESKRSGTMMYHLRRTR